MGKRMTPPMGMSPLSFYKMNIVLPYNDPWTCSCIKLMPYQASWRKRYANNEIKNHEQNINQVHPVQNVCSSCITLMYINIMQCAKRYHLWNVSIIFLYQHANMCIYQYANHVHPPICQPCASTNMPNNISYHSWYVSIMNQVPQSCISNKCQLLC